MRFFFYLFTNIRINGGYYEKEDLSVFIKSISRNVGRGIDEDNGDSAGRKMGDLALPCFSMAKKMRKNPMQIAAELVENLNEQKAELGIEK